MGSFFSKKTSDKKNIEYQQNPEEIQSLLKQEDRLVISTDLFKADGFTTLENYYLVQEHNTDIRWSVGQYVLIQLIAGGSVWLYMGGGATAGNNEVLKFKLVIAGMVLNFCATANTSKEFLDYLRNNQIPPSLADYLHSPINSLEIFLIGVGAFVSAGPLTLAAYTKGQAIDALFMTKAGVTQISNTFVHTFPLYLVASNPIIRNLFLSPLLPLIATIKLYQQIKYCLKDEKEKALIELTQVREKKARILKNNMLQTLKAGREVISQETFSLKRWHGIPYSYNITSPTINSLLGIAAKAPQFEEIPPQRWYQVVGNFCKNMLDGAVGNGLWLFGAGIGNVGSIGYYYNAEQEVEHLTDSAALGWGFSSPANLLLIIMTIYFCGKFMKETLWGSFVSIVKGEYSPPEGFKRYPKTVLALTMLGTYLSYYGYGTGKLLIEKNFQGAEFDEIRPYLIYSVQYGLGIFLLKNTLEYILDQSTSFVARYWGGDDNKASAILNEKIDKLINAISNMDPEEFARSLKNRSQKEQEQLLRMKPAEINKLLRLFERPIEELSSESAEEIRKFTAESVKEADDWRPVTLTV